MNWPSLSAMVLLPVFFSFGDTLASEPASQSVARQWNEQLLSSIRLSIPNPPSHARNLFHTSTAMYDAWAAYDRVAIGYLCNDKVSPLPSNIEAARNEAISHAAYRVLTARFSTGQNSTQILAGFDSRMASLGYSPSDSSAPALLGKRLGQAILDWSNADGFANVGYPVAYTANINPNLNQPLSVYGENLNGIPNMPLGFGIPTGTDPNLWQPLDLKTSVAQNGIPLPGGPQSFLGVQSMATTPFSLTRTDPLKPWLDPFGGPSKLSHRGITSLTDAAYKDGALGVLIASSQLNDPNITNISPAVIGNNPLGNDSGTGYAENPVTHSPLSANMVKVGDYTRVLAEFWADGPNSETPPGHWHVLANEVADDPALVKRIGGAGPVVNDLEWDVKVYFALSAATHDAACAAWALKRYYSGPRPITMIRYMASKGQCTNTDSVSYDPEGLPLLSGVVEIITAETSSPGGRHETIWDVSTGTSRPGYNFINQIAVMSWPGEDPRNAPAPSIANYQSNVRWMLAKDWLPFQRKTFNTPAFPGYVSGHSTFSRAAAEALTLITGSPYFPGGFHHHTIAANSLQIDKGPSAAVDLQWCSFYDAADQAGQSRRYGGIHPREDDWHGRYIGSIAGKSAYALAQKYWTGEIVKTNLRPTLTMATTGSANFSWTGVRGCFQKVQYSGNLVDWFDASAQSQTYDTVCSFTDAVPDPVKRFYRVLWSP